MDFNFISYTQKSLYCSMKICFLCYHDLKIFFFSSFYSDLSCFKLKTKHRIDSALRLKLICYPFASLMKLSWKHLRLGFGTQSMIYCHWFEKLVLCSYFWLTLLIVVYCWIFTKIYLSTEFRPVSYTCDGLSFYLFYPLA